MNALLKFVAKQLFAQKGMIANNKAVNFEAAKLAEKLSEFGIDPSSIKTEKQLEGIINQIKELQKKRMAESMEVIPQDDPRFKGIMSKMTGKNVIEANFGKPFKEEIINMREPKRFFKGVEIRDPKFDENLPFDNDAEKLAEIKMSNEAYEQELEKKIKERITKDNQKGIANIRKRQKMLADAIDDASPGFANDIKVDAELVAENLAGRMGKVYDDLSTKERLDLYDEAYTGLSKQRFKNMPKPDPEEKANGGRIGFKKGMDRRTFMKLMGGITALPVIGKYFKGAEVAAPIVEKAVDVASGAPPYFFNLVDRIRALGKKFGGPKERSESYIYKDYEMDIDLDTGKIDIKKTKEAMIPGGDEAGIAEEVYMTYKPGVADETTKGRKVVDEYEEFTARPDIDGKMKDVEDGVPDEVVREGSIGKEELEQEIVEQIARDKKASGGIAMMLGQ